MALYEAQSGLSSRLTATQVLCYTETRTQTGSGAGGTHGSTGQGGADHRGNGWPGISSRTRLCHNGRTVGADGRLPGIIDSPANRSQTSTADYSRWVKPEEIAAALIYLSSDEAAALNGASIPMYGRM